MEYRTKQNEILYSTQITNLDVDLAIYRSQRLLRCAINHRLIVKIQNLQIQLVFPLEQFHTKDSCYKIVAPTEPCSFDSLLK
jgi:hypothetical protein